MCFVVFFLLSLSLYIYIYVSTYIYIYIYITWIGRFVVLVAVRTLMDMAELCPSLASRGHERTCMLQLGVGWCEMIRGEECTVPLLWITGACELFCPGRGVCGKLS